MTALTKATVLVWGPCLEKVEALAIVVALICIMNLEAQMEERVQEQTIPPTWLPDLFLLLLTMDVRVRVELLIEM